MKKILSLLIGCVLIGCGEKRVLIDELTNKGKEGPPIYYSEEGLYSGLVYDVYENGQLKSNGNVKDGKPDGRWEWYHENGQLSGKRNYKDGKEEGLWEYFNEDGTLKKTETYKDGELVD